MTKNKKIAIIDSIESPIYFSPLVESLKMLGEVAVYGWNNVYDCVFDSDNTDLLVLPDSTKIPYDMITKIDLFLRNNGKLIALGGIPLNEPYFNLKGSWLCAKDYIEEITETVDKQVLFSFDDENSTSAFERIMPNNQSCAKININDFGSGHDKSAQFYFEDFHDLDGFKANVELSSKNNAITFMAKGTEKTTAFSILLMEKDGSMWFNEFMVDTVWHKFFFQIDDFKYFNRSTSSDRGYRGDKVNFDNVVSLAFGIGITQAYNVIPTGENMFYIDEIQTLSLSSSILGDYDFDGLYPGYKFFPVAKAVKIKAYDGQTIVRDVDYVLPRNMFSFHPRSQGTGFNKDRAIRFIPLIKVYDAKDLFSGYAAYTLINGNCKRRNNSYDGSIITVFTSKDDAFYNSDGIKAISDVAEFMLRDVYLYEGGAEEYAYFENDKSYKLGAAVVGGYETGNLKVNIQVSDVQHKVFEKSYEFLIKDMGKSRTKEKSRCVFTAGFVATGAKKYIVETSLYKDGELIDRLSHEINVWVPKLAGEAKHITQKGGDFIRDGKRLNFLGVNYMPSCNNALSDGFIFENYISAPAYDPDLIMEDLARVCEIGFNAISIFAYFEPSIHSNGLLDLMMRCEKLGLFIDLCIRPNANPMMFNEHEVASMINKYRLWDYDNLIAYDIAWERYFGAYEPEYGNFFGRKAYDTEWEKWIVNHYGSVEEAEKEWEYPCPRKAGIVTGVSDMMLEVDGLWRKLVSSYRRFADDFAEKKHAYAKDFIKNIDPNHLVSFRMGATGGIPLAKPGLFGYDFRSLAGSMDFMSPESYSMGYEWKTVRQGVFTNNYARYANKEAPFAWKEFGYTMWSGSNFKTNKYNEMAQADFYRTFFDMHLMGYGSAVYAWWWAGGYRIGENSDFGVLNPDGTDREVTKVIREYKDRIINRPKMPEVTYAIKIDRDEHVSNIKAIYERIEGEMFDAIDNGRIIGLYDEGTGTTSLDTPLMALCNVPYNNKNVIKYLNSEFREFAVTNRYGKFETVSDFCAIKVVKGQDVLISARMCNTQSAKWIAPANCAGKPGGVYLKSAEGSMACFEIPIRSDVDYLGFCEMKDAVIIRNIQNDMVIGVYMSAKDRCVFGEKLTFKLELV